MAASPDRNSDAGATFEAVLDGEIGVLNARRAWLAKADGWRDDGSAAAWKMERTDGGADEFGEPICRLQSGPEWEIAALALSGGGIRSAAFCFGVLQGLQAVVPRDGPQILDAVDYLSTVSGGGYIGASTVAGILDEGGRFPYTSSLDQAETIETQHLRDFANFLVPDGAMDVLGGLIVLARGLLLNAVILLPLIFGAAVLTVWLNPTETELTMSYPKITLGGFHTAFTWTLIFAGGFILSQVAYAIMANRPREQNRTSLLQREAAGTIFVGLLLLCGLVVFFEFQAFVLKGLFDAAHLNRRPDDIDGRGWLGLLIHHTFVGYGSLWAFFTAAIGGFGMFGAKLLKIAEATFGDNSWSGFLKHWGSRLAVYAGALLVPLGLWALYLFFAYAGIGWRGQPETGCVLTAASPSCPAVLHTPPWLSGLAALLAHGSVPCLYLLAVAVFLLLSLLITPNANSLHGYYRDRLSRAFLWSLKALNDDMRERKAHRHRWYPALREALRAGPRHESADSRKLSSLKPHAPAARHDPADSNATLLFPPYLLINTSVNLEASKYLNRRGRNADSFIFSPLHTGSEATGYVATAALEKVDRHVDVATAMAISGAAASANMGASTIRPLTFSLAVLNIRLGYWLPNPRSLPFFRNSWWRWSAHIGPLYFAMEALGLLDEWARNVYLTDGGHFDNLGLYQLLRRRCKIIVVADAEEDPAMNFGALIRLQRYARIDLGVRIELPWEDLRRFSRQITVDQPHGPSDDVKECIGPHICIGKIEYRSAYGEQPELGVLIYIKACISGDESDLIRDYRRRNPAFPHETTLDQFFTEEQFEVYRALGFHATQSFFTGKDRFAMRAGTPEENWPDLVEGALRRLNVSRDAIARIMARQRPAPAGTA